MASFGKGHGGARTPTISALVPPGAGGGQDPALHLAQLPGRLTRSTCRFVLHLPAGWSWAAW
jgi:hypothetical protein